jgi:hypothetical protein
MLLTECHRGQVAQPRMRPHLVVVAPPGLDRHPCLGARAEPLQAQTLVPELAVEALVGAVLPGLAWVDVGGADARLGEPAQDRRADELRSVVRAQVCRRPALADQARARRGDSRAVERVASSVPWLLAAACRVASRRSRDPVSSGNALPWAMRASSDGCEPGWRSGRRDSRPSRNRGRASVPPTVRGGRRWTRPRHVGAVERYLKLHILDADPPSRLCSQIGNARCHGCENAVG